MESIHFSYKLGDQYKLRIKELELIKEKGGEKI